MQTQDITASIKSVLAANKAKRDTLAASIASIMDAVPRGVILGRDGVTVEKRAVYCGCSQWSNRTWDVTGKSEAILVDGMLVCDVDPNVWDGNNHHHRRTGLYLDREGHGLPLRMAPAVVLRKAAAVLPESIRAWLASIEKDTSETGATLASL